MAAAGIRRAEDWLEAAQRAIDAGPPELRTFLDHPPDNLTTPLETQTYLRILDLVIGRPGIPDDSGGLVDVVLQHIRNENPHYSPTTPALVGGKLSTTTLRYTRTEGLTSATSRISEYDLFDHALRRTRLRSDEPEARRRLWPVVAQAIWDGASDQLLTGGGIYLCARHGFHELLQIIIDEHLESRPDKLDILFLANPDTTSTPLGTAISNGNLACVQAILDVEGAFQHAVTADDVLGDPNIKGPFLHSFLSVTKQTLAISNYDPEKLQQIESILDYLISAGYNVLQPCSILTRPDAAGNSPYQYATNQQPSVGDIHVVDYLRRKIFEQLKDPDEVRMALYGTSGMSLTTDIISVPQVDTGESRSKYVP
jgi:hypothetical protein